MSKSFFPTQYYTCYSHYVFVVSFPSQTWYLACFSVWQKLEEENREFFKAYYLRLMVKQQINEFNRLLDQQVQLMRQMQPTGVASLPTSNGSHISTCKTLFMVSS
jgi:hypothetical protein